MIRLPRTIRLDRSDEVIFAPAAAPGEWAVPGTFLFAGRDPETLSRKERVALRSGFLGIESFGWSTLVTVSLVRREDRDAAVAALAAQLVAHLGAPGIEVAMPAAEEELALAEDLCRGHAEGTLIALHRSHEEGALRERFRTLKPRDETAFSAGYLGGHDKAFHFVETDEDEGEDVVDLRGLAEGSGTR
ncbi:DUF6505 family protein [Roseovarius aquimarinus]|uniref:DUF6505 family protein n=1 Tax=Roseovarius aquimarinus TaxID=1229156 RepID=A0ABW7I7R5_9RHOB